jgi:hypothetical protein
MLMHRSERHNPVMSALKLVQVRCGGPERLVPFGVLAHHRLNSLSASIDAVSALDVFSPC